MDEEQPNKQEKVAENGSNEQPEASDEEDEVQQQ